MNEITGPEGAAGAQTPPRRFCVRLELKAAYGCPGRACFSIKKTGLSGLLPDPGQKDTVRPDKNIRID